MGQLRENEIQRHDATKTRLENQYKERASLILSDEGIEQKVISVILAALGIVIGLWLAPEPVLTKVIGALVGLGLSAFVAYLVVRYLTRDSVDQIGAQQDAHNAVKRKRMTATITSLRG